jgi:hypothetical protein
MWNGISTLPYSAFLKDPAAGFALKRVISIDAPQWIVEALPT